MVARGHRGESLVSVNVYVEGGGDSKLLRTECRKGFSQFLEKAGLKGRMPSITACGGRQNAYESFCTAFEQGQTAMLLVDSEAPYTATSPWQHLKDRLGDNWHQPAGASDKQCHLMVECMENWFLADRHALSEFFGQEFRSNALPTETSSIELIAKQTVYDALKKATKNCKSKGEYGKGKHSFLLLGIIDPGKIMASSDEAKRFITDLKMAMG